jgi:hypothetical protein
MEWIFINLSDIARKQSGNVNYIAQFRKLVFGFQNGKFKIYICRPMDSKTIQ